MILSTKACEYIDSLAKGARMRIESLANTISLNYNDAIDYVMCFGEKSNIVLTKAVNL